MDGGAPDYKFVHDNLPNTLVLARNWARSEQHSDMLANPVGTGQRHAREWDDQQRELGFDRAKTVVLGINEPTVWEPGFTEALRLYTIALCDEAGKLGLRVGAMQFGVGWPNNNGPDTPPDWSPWHGCEDAIIRNNGVLVTHCYWADSGPAENWGWWAGRVLKCPWQVPIAIGECGVDMFVKDTSVGQQHRGWIGHMPPERYAAELNEYVSRMSADSRFVGCCVFASDFQAHEWYSFDVEPAYNAILALPPAPTVPATPPSTVHLPSIKVPDGPHKTMWVNAPAGLNLRETPRDGKIVATVPYATPVTVLGANVSEGVSWSAVVLGDGTTLGYMLTSLLSPIHPIPPTPAPQPEPSTDCWQRALAFVRRWEGGWADNPADPGGATNKGVTIGTFIKWRIEHGQGTPTKDDLRNLSDEEANQIYREWYWLASGADKLPWPLCLAHFDTAVNSGPGNAAIMLKESGGNFLSYMASLIEFYTGIQGFGIFGKAWMARRADLLREASKA
jgi:hypothetical protein